MASLQDIMNVLATKYDRWGGEISGSVSIRGSLSVDGAVVPSGRAFGTTFTDYAEYFERGEDTEHGDIIMLNIYSEKEEYVKAVKDAGPVVGVHNDDFAMIIGAKKEFVEHPDMVELNKKVLIPVALKGRTMVKVKGKVSLGDIIVASKEPGIGEVDNECTDRYKYVGKAITSSDEEGVKLIKILIR